MQIQVVGGSSIAEFYRAFQEMFPYLRMELSTDESSATGGLLPSKFKLLENGSNEDIMVAQDTRFSDLASALLKNFGLRARLYRKAASSWIETINTRNWTLQDQNNQGQRISSLLGEIGEDRPLD